MPLLLPHTTILMAPSTLTNGAAGAGVMTTMTAKTTGMTAKTTGMTAETTGMAAAIANDVPSLRLRLRARYSGPVQ
jgi:hypothetical protein